MFSKLSLEGGANGSPHCFGTCIHTHLRGRWVSIVPTDFDLWAASAPLGAPAPVRLSPQVLRPWRAEGVAWRR